MQVKAKADKGLLINEVATSASPSWDDTATTNQVAPIELRPTSTANTKTWYSATSKSSSSAAGATAGSASSDLSNGYTTLTTTEHTLQAASAGVSVKQDVYFVDQDGDSGYDAGEGYYVKYTYYIKSSAEAIACSTADKAYNLNIKKVSAEVITADPVTSSPELNKALRAAVVVGGKAYIFAPIAGFTASYYVNAGANATAPFNGLVAVPTGTVNIPAKQNDGLAVYVYLYFEGEDAACKTDNVTALLDGLNVEVQFSLETNNGAVTDGGVTVPQD